MLSQNAQEAAPFELLIGVILLGFVLVMGFIVLSQSQESQCEQEAGEMLEELRASLEALVSDEKSKHLLIESPPCFSGKSEIYIKRERNNREICSLFCSGANESCFLLGFSTEDFSKILCLRIPFTTSFKQPDPTSLDLCPNTLEDTIPEGFEHTAFGYAKVEHGVLEGTIEEGEYFFWRDFVYEDYAPSICAYKKLNT